MRADQTGKKQEIRECLEERAILPPEAWEAARETDRLVCVRCGEEGARLTYYKKEAIWREEFSCPAHIGKSGAGKTREGDMKTPLGVFSLSTPFGILPDPSREDAGGRRCGGYLRLTESHYWCGQNGPHYNRLIDMKNPPEGYRPTDADEQMIGYAPSYHYGMFIGYNEEGLPGLGSAIFLHCMGKHPYTAGCVAVEEKYMRELILELGQGAKIVIFRKN